MTDRGSSGNNVFMRRDNHHMEKDSGDETILSSYVSTLCSEKLDSKAQLGSATPRS
jgi:hypothetical protein